MRHSMCRGCDMKCGHLQALVQLSRWLHGPQHHYNWFHDKLEHRREQCCLAVLHGRHKCLPIHNSSQDMHQDWRPQLLLFRMDSRGRVTLPKADGLLRAETGKRNWHNRRHERNIHMTLHPNKTKESTRCTPWHSYDWQSPTNYLHIQVHQCGYMSSQKQIIHSEKR